MSQENVELVRQNLEDWQRDDFEAFLSKAHPEIEWYAVLERLVEGPESAYHGHEGVRRLWQTYKTELDSFGVEADEIRDVGDDRVVLLGDVKAVSRDAKAGRRLWASLGAWPWWGVSWWSSLAPGSAFPKRWWQNVGAGEALFFWRYDVRFDGRRQLRL